MLLRAGGTKIAPSLAVFAQRTHAANPAHRCGNDFPWPPGKALIAFRQPAQHIFIEDCAPHRVAPEWNGLCDGPRSST
jgi:hypothetical protein